MKDNLIEIEELRAAYDADQANSDIASRLAQLYTDRGWLNEAIAIYKKLITIYPNDFSILLAYGNICFSKQYLQESLQIFSRLTVMKPDRVEGWNNLGITQLSLSDYKSAKKSFQKVLELEPENHGALLNLGNYYDHLEEFTKAIDLFKRAIAIRPDFIDAWYNLGNAYLKGKEYEKAIQAYEKSLKYKPKFFSAFKNIGFAYEQLEKYTQAEKYYFKALDLNKTDAALYVNIAAIYFKQNAYDKAKDFYLNAVKLSPQEFGGWLGLRELSLKIGDITTYVKSTLVIMKHLEGGEIAFSLKTLRKLEHQESIDSLIQSADKLEKSGNELDAERMIAYNCKGADKLKASLLYRKLQGLENPSDHILNCLAHYCFVTNVYDQTIQYIDKIKEKDISDYMLLWSALIEKKEYSIAEQHIEKHLSNNQDCFEGWFQLAKIEAKLNNLKKAKEYLVCALEAGFTDLDRINNEGELKIIYNNSLQT